MNNNNLLKSATIIVICTFLSKILGLLRDIITASKFGAGSQLDAFFAASNVPSILFITIGVAITTTLIPLYNEKLKEGKKSAIDFLNNTINLFVCVTFIISLIFIIFNKQLISFLNPGFYGEQLLLTQKLTIILIPTLIFNSVIFIFNGMLQSENNFVVPALYALPFNIIIIFYLIFYGKKCGILGLTIVTMIATFIQILPQVYYANKCGYKYKFMIDFHDPVLKRMLYMIGPVILGTGVQQINSFVERGIATKFDLGSLSAMSYAYRVFALIIDIFVVTISTVIYPKMARETVNNKMEDMKKTLSETLRLIIIYVLPVSLIVMINSKPIIYILFQRGQFDNSSTLKTSSILLIYSLGILAFGLRDFVCKAYYTLKDTKTPMINSAIAMVINIVLIFTLSKFFALKGIIMANVISMYIACLLLVISLKKKIGSIGGIKIFNVTIKTVVSSMFMIGAIHLCNGILNIKYVSTMEVFFKVILSSTAGILVFIGVAFIINLEEVKQIKNIINRKQKTI